MIYIALFIYMLWFVISQIITNYICTKIRSNAISSVVGIIFFISLIEVLYLILFLIGTFGLQGIGFSTSVLFFIPLSIPIVLTTLIGKVQTLKLWQSIVWILPIIAIFNVIMLMNSSLYYNAVTNIISIDIICVGLILTKKRNFTSRLRWMIYIILWVLILHDGDNSYNHLCSAILLTEIVSTASVILIEKMKSEPVR